MFIQQTFHPVNLSFMSHNRSFISMFLGPTIILITLNFILYSVIVIVCESLSLRIYDTHSLQNPLLPRLFNYTMQCNGSTYVYVCTDFTWVEVYYITADRVQITMSQLPPRSRELSSASRTRPLQTARAMQRITHTHIQCSTQQILILIHPAAKSQFQDEPVELHCVQPALKSAIVAVK